MGCWVASWGAGLLVHQTMARCWVVSWVVGLFHGVLRCFMGCWVVGASDIGSLLGCSVASGVCGCTLVGASDDELLLGSWVASCGGGWLLAALSVGCESLMATDVAMKSLSLKTWRFWGHMPALSKPFTAVAMTGAWLKASVTSSHPPICSLVEIRRQGLEIGDIQS